LVFWQVQFLVAGVVINLSFGFFRLDVHRFFVFGFLFLRPGVVVELKSVFIRGFCNKNTKPFFTARIGEFPSISFLYG